MHNVSPATAKKKNNFASCIAILLRDDFLSHFRKILLNTARMKVNKCYSDFFCHVYLHLNRISATCHCFQAWSSTLCALNDFICIVLSVFCTTPLCIFIQAEVPNIQPVFGSRWKTRHPWNQFVLLLPNDLKFAFIFRIAIKFLWLRMRSEISHVIFIKVAFMPCDVVSCVLARSCKQTWGKSNPLLGLFSKQEKIFSVATCFVARASFCHQ